MRGAFFFLLFFIGSIGIVNLLISESSADNFIVKKTKQVIVAYADQWCDLFGKLLQSLADLDIQKSMLQKKGINHIMHAIESGNDIAIARLPKSDQQAAVQELQKLTDQVQKTTMACELYTKKLKTLLADNKKSKK